MIGFVIFGASTPRQRVAGTGFYPCRHCGDAGPHEVTHLYRVASLMFVPFLSTAQRWVATCRMCRQAMEVPNAPPGALPLPFMQRMGWIVLFPTLAMVVLLPITAPLIANILDRPRREAASRAQREFERAATAQREQDRLAAAALELQVKEVVATREQIDKEDRACADKLLTQLPKRSAFYKLAEKRPKSVDAIRDVPFTVTRAGFYSRDNPLLRAKQMCFTPVPDKLASLRWASDLARHGPLEERRAEANSLLSQARSQEIPPVHAYIDGTCDKEKRTCTAVALWQRIALKHETLAVARVSVPLPDGGESAALKQLGAALATKVAAWK